MAAERCPECGTVAGPGARFCAHCGAPRSFERPGEEAGRRYTPLRFQIDPLSPPPRRDPRYVLIVVGAAVLVLGFLFLLIAVIVDTAVSSGCPGPSCAAVDPGPWFLYLSVPLLALGAGMAAVGLWRGFHGPAPID